MRKRERHSTDYTVIAVLVLEVLFVVVRERRGSSDTNVPIELNHPAAVFRAYHDDTLRTCRRTPK